MPWYVDVFIVLVLAVTAFVFVVWPALGSLAKADELKKRLWEKRFRKLHPELYEEEDKDV